MILEKYEITNEDNKLVSESNENSLVIFRRKDVLDMAGFIEFEIPVYMNIGKFNNVTNFWVENIVLTWIDWSNYGLKVSINGGFGNTKFEDTKHSYYSEISDIVEDLNTEEYHSKINSFAIKLINLFKKEGLKTFQNLLENHMNNYENNLSKLFLDYIVEKINWQKNKFYDIIYLIELNTQKFIIKAILDKNVNQLSVYK